MDFFSQTKMSQTRHWHDADAATAAHGEREPATAGRSG